MSEFNIGDLVLVALDVLDIYAEDTPIPDDPRFIRKGTLVLGYSEDPGDRITAMPEMVRAVSPVPAGELRERIKQVIDEETGMDWSPRDAWLDPIVDAVMAVLNGEGER